MIWCIKTYIIAYVKTQKNKIHYPLCQAYNPTVVSFRDYELIANPWYIISEGTFPLLGTTVAIPHRHLKYT